MPANRQQRQHNPLTCTNARAHLVSARQHRQRTPPPVLTLLTPADARQHNKSAGQRILLTVLTINTVRQRPLAPSRAMWRKP